MTVLFFTSQVNVVVDGDKKVVEFSFQSLLRNTLRYTFKSRDLHALFDRQWHKLSISVQTNAVSIYMDCKLIERRATDERASIDPSGRTLITTRIEDGRPVDVCPMINMCGARFFFSTANLAVCYSICSLVQYESTPTAFKQHSKHVSGAS